MIFAKILALVGIIFLFVLVATIIKHFLDKKSDDLTLLTRFFDFIDNTIVFIASNFIAIILIAVSLIGILGLGLFVFYN